MNDSDKKEPESPVEDLKKGIGLLFRAAKGAAQDAAHRLQSDKLDGALKSSLHEIGRAVGNVAQTLERELRGDDTNKKS